MTIQPTDIKLLESERMRDTPDGGGRMTGRVIPSGEAGNVFPKVSRVDSVYGRVNLRKIYVAVRTATLDMYAGAHAIITDPPQNARISCCLFSTGSSFDQRAGARDRIESYVVAGPLSQMRIYGTQLVGQKAIRCYQRVEEPLPDVGEVLVLSVEKSGYTPVQQFVRITDMSHITRTFVEWKVVGSTVVEFQRRVLTLEISAPLAQKFEGEEPTQFQDTSPTKLRMTHVADASKYYGIQPLAEAGELGALALQIASVYAPLVPSTQRETGVRLAELAGAAGAQQSSADRYSAAAFSMSEGGRHYFPGPILPGSIRARRANSTLLPITTDDGNGTLRVWGTESQLWTFEVNYEQGYIDGAGGFSTASIGLFEYHVGTIASSPTHTRSVEITLGTRGTVYVETLLPVPAPGTLIVDFRALGRWYRLRDNGAGEMVANDPSEGTGSIDYVTGVCVITLGALPDVGSAVLFAWGSPVHYTIRAGAASDAASALRLAFTLEKRPVVPGTHVATYPVAGVNRSTTANSNGTISGDGVSGTINHTTGEVVLNFSQPPDRAAQISNAYTWRDGDNLIGGAESATVAGGEIDLSALAPFRGTGALRFALANGIVVDGWLATGGTLWVSAGSGQPGHVIYAWNNQQVGTFNAATGILTISNSVTVSSRTWDANAGVWQYNEQSIAIVSASQIAVETDTEAFDPAAVADEQVFPSALGLTLDLTTTVGDPVVPGSVMVRVTGLEYVDRSGSLVTQIDSLTGSGTAAGSINYETGRCTLNYWADNAAANILVRSCLTRYGDWTSTGVAFRTAGSPIRPASLYVQATTTDGDLITGTADQNGLITGAYMAGNVQQDMGVVEVEFGDNSGEAGAWVPREILPGTLRYNCVVITNLPLDPAILGLDPVRLPMDGRVPIYRPGDLVVIHNTQRTTLPDPVVAGQSYDVGRTDCAVIVLEDAAGDELAADRYVADLAAGTVEMAADWDGDGVAQPLVAVHRIEHMTLLSDVQINGQIELASPLPREFPAEGTYVSSALLFGDVQAIVTNVFDQQTWTSVWSDTLIASQANAEYDTINYPIEVINESAVTERWRVHFTSATAFQVYGENLGLIATGNTSTDLAPINPVTGEAYFVLRAAGWGGGWATGNNLRFNTVGANGPVWIARTILAGATLAGDRFHLEARGDVDVED